MELLIINLNVECWYTCNLGQSSSSLTHLKLFSLAKNFLRLQRFILLTGYGLYSHFYAFTINLKMLKATECI